MKDLSLSTFLAVFEEMYGFWLFWGLVAVALVVTLTFLAVLLRERQVRSGRLIAAEIIGLVGGFAAVLFVQLITSSRFSDLGGPIDVIVMLGIWLAGAGGALVAAYAAMGLLSRTGKATG
jgi:hypothetical protein